jgi:transcriptional regulator with XRE-family HTH domain
MEITFKKNRIKELRENIHYSQRELAVAIHTSQANLSRWEKGLNEPSIVECWKLAVFFDVTIDYLFGKEND